MVWRILAWLLKLVDVTVRLRGDILSLKLILGKMTVLDKEIDLIPSQGGERIGFKSKAEFDKLT